MYMETVEIKVDDKHTLKIWLTGSIQTRTDGKKFEVTEIQVLMKVVDGFSERHSFELSRVEHVSPNAVEGPGL